MTLLDTATVVIAFSLGWKLAEYLLLPIMRWIFVYFMGPK